MAYYFNDRVQETSTTTGTTTSWVLSGAVPGYKTFTSVCPVAGDTYYAIVNESGSQWEVGFGRMASTTVLTRFTVFSNSLGNTSLVNFSAGTKYTFMTMPASKSMMAAKMSGAGSLLTVDSSNNIVDVPLGTAGKFLSSTGTALAWGSISNSVSFTVKTGTSVAIQDPVAITSDMTVAPVAQSVTGHSGLSLSSGTRIGSVAALTTVNGANGVFPIYVYSDFSYLFVAIGYRPSPSSEWEFSTYGNNNITYSYTMSSPDALSAAWDPVAGCGLIAFGINNSGTNEMRYSNIDVAQTSIGASLFDPGVTLTSGMSPTNIATCYDPVADCMLTVTVNSSSNIILSKSYKNTPTSSYTNYVSSVNVTTGGTYSDPAGYTFSCAFDATNGAAIFFVRTSAGAVSAFGAKGTNNSSGVPTFTALTSVTTNAANRIGNGSATYSSGLAGVLFAVGDSSANNVKYAKVTCNGVAVPTVGSFSTISWAPGVPPLAVSVASNNGGSVISFAAASSSTYYNASATASSGVVTVTVGFISSVTDSISTNWPYIVQTYSPSVNYEFCNLSPDSSFSTANWAFTPSYSTNIAFIGIAQSAGSGGSSVQVVLTNNIATSSGSPGYSVGSRYYVSSSGSINTSSSGVYVGKATSSTSILVLNSPGLAN